MMDSLLKGNQAALAQGETLLQRLSDDAYRSSLKPVFNSSIGAHIRHNLDHYGCFLEGLALGRIDYAARRRSPCFETERLVAVAELKRIRQEFETIVSPHAPLLVRIDNDAGAAYSGSSLVRELEFLISHTIHHYAIVAIMCRLQGIAVDDDFGVAPSTLRYRAEMETPCAP